MRPPSLQDGSAVFALIESSPPLDLNSRYAYFLLCDHFAATTAVAEGDGAIMGFLGGYRPPTRTDTLFVWQVAVGDSARGQGLAGAMLNDILQRPENEKVRFVEATVSPSNEPSRAFFKRFAEQRCAVLEEGPYLEATDFGESGHEAETLIRIGPFHDAMNP
ncbi:MAG: diaminobutyrate acetyltransferase [Rhodospirillales bacterium]|nr:diaminobutyrate acetyltransferase [Rhodospirillales bacterium]MCW9001315.1 diaminobutyrate acetyltransferase [Rhodospirillales bacterium]